MSPLRVSTFFPVLVVIATFLTTPTHAFTGLKPLVILMPGAGGPVSSDFVMRNRDRFRAAGFDTKVITIPRTVTNAANVHSDRRKVFLVGADRGANNVAAAIALGAQVDAAVMISGNYRNAKQTLLSPALLPPTLIVHHSGDRCQQTPPSNVPTFVKWAHGKAHVAWMSMPGKSDRTPCGPFDAHGFYLNDAEPVALIIRFLRTQ
ncbi:hypothetical protein [uncultured Roseibium sp.]|uniref:hypothetical protein n=1 Tax=uncultured Roseibium sp. TaxID=1936171 RepID=UPI003217119F